MGKTIEEIMFWFFSLEKCCYAQLMADAAATGRVGHTCKIEDEEAAFTVISVGTSMAGWFSAIPEFENTDREQGADHL